MKHEATVTQVGDADMVFKVIRKDGSVEYGRAHAVPAVPLKLRIVRSIVRSIESLKRKLEES